MKTTNLEKTKKLVAIALFCAVGYIGMLFRFNVSFLTFDLKDALITIGAMFFGPLSGIAMAAIVDLLEFITISDTGIYGLIMNFLSSAVFASVAPLIYKYKRSLNGAIWGLLCSVICTVSVMIAANLLITPYYMGVSIDAVKELIPTLLLPFNATKSVMNAAFVLLLYKPVTRAIRATKLITAPLSASTTVKQNNKMNSVIVAVISLLIIIACFVIFFKFMNGSF